MKIILSSIILAASVGCASAATFTFANDPVAGFDRNDGVRQVNGANALSLPSFDVTADNFAFDLGALGITGPISFVNSLAQGLRGSLANVIVLQDSDNDGNPATPFNAGTAANLIAASVNGDRAGLFVYFNSVLNIDRLVYSSNLASSTADLAILAAIQSPTGFDAIAALPTFTAANFTEVAPVPLPAALPMLAFAMSGFAWMRRRKAATAAALA